MKTIETACTTPECTILWPAVFEPESFKRGDEKYRCVLLFDKETDLSGLKRCISAAAMKKFAGKDQATFKSLRLPIRDGAEKATGPTGKPDTDNIFFNKLFLSVKSDYQPQIVDVMNRPIEDPKEIYGGCRVVADLSFYGYDHLGNRGVSASLGAIMKIADGKPIGGGKIDTARAFADYIKKPDTKPMLDSAFGGKKKTKREPGDEDLSEYYTEKNADDYDACAPPRRRPRACSTSSRNCKPSWTMLSVRGAAMSRCRPS